MSDDPRIGGFQVESTNLTGYCKVCGVLLGDIAAHLAWHDAPLDPRPWIYQDGERWATPFSDDDERPAFQPRDDYQQDSRFYLGQERGNVRPGESATETRRIDEREESQ